MSELIRPQITFSPEGILDILTDLDEDLKNKNPEASEALRTQQQESIKTYNLIAGTQSSISNGSVNIKIDIAERFNNNFDDHGANNEIELFLSHLGYIVPFHLNDLTDRVVGLEFPGKHGSIGVINQHFQRWLNTSGITEEAARHSLEAMSIPFGSKHRKEVKKRFQFRSGSGFEQVSDSGWHFSITSQDDEYGVNKTGETDETHTETHGKASWRWLNMVTLGNCACWSASGDARSCVRIDPSTRRLYEMLPHNIDYAKQSLSLILGIGALAYHAAQYDGREDIFSDVIWNEPRVYPKTNK